jgi:beta-lactam-binding protein with PASTA domain
MSTPPEHQIARDELVYDETADTVDTVVGPPVVPPVAPPPPLLDGYPAGERIVVEETAATRAATTPSGDRVLVDDPARTRVVSREVGPPYPPDEDPRRWNWLAPTLVVICLAALGIVLAAILLGRDDDNTASTTTAPPVTTVQAPVNAEVPVPSTVGQSRNAAESALEGAGLTVIVATVPGPAPAGQVLAQAPGAGETATSGDTVRINVSDGAQTASGGTGTAPATQTPTEPESQTAETPATTPATTPSGSAQTTPAETTPAETPPAQPTAPEPEPTTAQVPALSGDVKAAVQRLNSAGLLASIQYVPSDEPLGTVTAQSPSEGASTKTGSHVTLSVASGPGEKQQLTVPDAAGQTIPQAVETMNAAGVRLILLKKTVTDREQAGKVVEQTPQPGAKAPKNAQILVYMGAYKG